MIEQGGEKQVYLYFIVCDHVLDAEVCKLLLRLEADRHIKVDKVHGCWKEKHLRTHVWPGEYHAILTTLTQDKDQILSQELKKLRRKFPRDEVWAWKVPLDSTI